jgi:hypothetical protein
MFAIFLKVKKEMALKEDVAEALRPSTSDRETIAVWRDGKAGYRRKKSSCRK